MRHPNLAPSQRMLTELWLSTRSIRCLLIMHQAGLAFDIRHGNGTLVTNGPAAEWISANAHKYGFIVRYQSGKEHITGYSAEPWHLRYIGGQATAVHESGQTLEEYLGVPGGSY